MCVFFSVIHIYHLYNHQTAYTTAHSFRNLLLHRNKCRKINIPTRGMFRPYLEQITLLDTSVDNNN